MRAAETIGVRWMCVEVLEALGDGRTPAVLEQLHVDVQAEVAQLAEPADRERQMRDRPDYGGIVAAYRRICGEPKSMH